MTITPYKERSLNPNKEVWVYRCLNRKGHVYSVKQDGYVVGHTTDINLSFVQFVVNAAGKKKAMETKTRNVHAFIKGRVNEEIQLDYKFMTSITYNPFLPWGFHEKGNINCVVDSTLHVTINEKGVFI